MRFSRWVRTVGNIALMVLCLWWSTTSTFAVLPWPVLWLMRIACIAMILLEAMQAYIQMRYGLPGRPMSQAQAREALRRWRD